jgi:hypothetical protein
MIEPCHATSAKTIRVGVNRGPAFGLSGAGTEAKESRRYGRGSGGNEPDPRRTGVVLTETEHGETPKDGARQRLAVARTFRRTKISARCFPIPDRTNGRRAGAPCWRDFE